MQTEEKTATEMESPELPEAIEYAGFWIRVMATLIDSVIVMIITLPIITAIYGEVPRDGYTYLQGGWDLVINYLFPAVAVIVFWIYKSATPGKLLTKISIVDAKTGGKPSTGQFIVRYFGYFVSIIPLCAGLIWVAFDERKQGWHDKIAGTVVIRNKVTDNDVNSDIEGLKPLD
jgi:uncharacterized RDD family membrane protein YckC